jgi:hypothetical protein
MSEQPTRYLNLCSQLELFAGLRVKFSKYNFAQRILELYPIKVKLCLSLIKNQALKMDGGEEE